MLHEQDANEESKTVIKAAAMKGTTDASSDFRLITNLCTET